MKPARESASSCPTLCGSLKKTPQILPARRSLLAFVRRKQTVVSDQFFPQKPPGSRLWFWRTGVQHSSGSSAIKPPSAFAESGAYPPDRTLPCSRRQWVEVDVLKQELMLLQPPLPQGDVPPDHLHGCRRSSNVLFPGWSRQRKRRWNNRRKR